MKKITYYLPLSLVFWATLSFANEQLHIFGRVETAKLMDQNIELEVKMDTGALTASLSAHDIKIFKKDGQDWVSFVLNGTHFKNAKEFQYPLKRMANIKKRQAEIKSGTSELEVRPVIAMDLCLGNEIKLVEVSLTNRSNFKYPMLLGRTAMEQFGVLIDPSAINTTQPSCELTPTGTKSS